MKRQTRHRQVIKDVLLKYRNHPTAEEIYIKAKLQIPNLNISTVYRNLRELVRSGEVVEIRLDHEKNARYDIVDDGHQHFYCKVCGKIYDIMDVDISYSTEHKVEDVKLVFYGTCKECSRRSEYEGV